MIEEKSPHLRVLVVEDELLIRWSITETLANAGHTVLEAGDAAAAVRAVSDTSSAIDVVLLDFRLPDSNDLTLLSNIRRLTPQSAVVMMTAFGTPEVVNGAKALGVCQFLSKPIDMHEIEPVVRHANSSRAH
jgi:DNA-binding NtrC family response regulator